MSLVKFNLIDCGELKSVGALLKDIDELRTDGDKHKLWYRGQSCLTQKLEPSIARLHEFAGREQKFKRFEEDQLLNRFRRRAFALDRRVVDAGYALFLARHYGLPTRLLDWTASPLFALYFACTKHECSDGRLWAFRQRDDCEGRDAFDILGKNDERELFGGDNPEPLEVRIVFPLFNSPRMVAQDGGFTWHSHPWTPLEQLDGSAFDSGKLDIEHLYKWLIPMRLKTSIVRELSGLGISRRSMFPDLDGIAQSLWETEVLWRGDLIARRSSP
jgi:FRG domain-containing protein